MTIGHRLRAVMAKKGWRQVDAARELGIPQSHLSAYLRDRSTSRIERTIAFLERLAKAESH